MIESGTVQEQELVAKAIKGSKDALSELFKLHYSYIYNVAVKFTGKHEQALDLTQEVCFKIVQKLPGYNGHSQFRTWLYRIVFNQFLNEERKKKLPQSASFGAYGEGLEQLAIPDFSPQEQIIYKEQIEEYKLRCMTGMLLCLDEKHRLVYILAELFELKPNTIASLLELTNDNCRKILSRARKKLYNFMTQKCGLINKNNPCRCSKQVKELANKGKGIPPDYNLNTPKSYKEEIVQRINYAEELIYEQYAALFKDHPFYDKKELSPLLIALLSNQSFWDAFELAVDKNGPMGAN